MISASEREHTGQSNAPYDYIRLQTYKSRTGIRSRRGRIGCGGRGGEQHMCNTCAHKPRSARAKALEGPFVFNFSYPPVVEFVVAVAVDNMPCASTLVSEVGVVEWFVER